MRTHFTADIGLREVMRDWLVFQFEDMQRWIDEAVKRPPDGKTLSRNTPGQGPRKSAGVEDALGVGEVSPVIEVCRHMAVLAWWKQLKSRF